MKFTWILACCLTALISYTNSQSANAKMVTADKENHVVLKGSADTLTISWTIENLKKKQYKVFANEKKIYGLDDEGDFVGFINKDDESKYEVKEDESEGIRELSLTIKQFSASDVGVYKCNLPLAGKTATINVYELECDTDKPDKPVIFGNTGEMQCMVKKGDGTPQPSLQWNDEPVSTSGSAKLTFTAAEDLMGKSATCKATIADVEQTCSQAYSVTSPYKLKQITSDPAKGTGDILSESRNKITLTCEVEGSPEPKFSWTVNNVAVTTAQTKTLVLDTKDYGASTKNYDVMCSVSTQSGKDVGTASYKFQLYEQVASEQVNTEGGSAATSASGLLALGLLLITALLR